LEIILDLGTRTCRHRTLDILDLKSTSQIHLLSSSSTAVVHQAKAFILQPADIMKNDLINPIRLEFQTNQLSFQRGPSGPNIQPHTTAVHHDRGGQTHAKRAELNLIC